MEGKMGQKNDERAWTKSWKLVKIHQNVSKIETFPNICQFWLHGQFQMPNLSPGIIEYLSA